jgi:tagatose 6-phosphate kinase
VTAAGRGPVVCAALNPALDITYVSPRFVTGEANRVGRAHTRPGGKAVNVARLLSQAGHHVIVTGLAGGPVGDEIVRQLADAEIPHRFTRCAAASRRTVSAFSVEDGSATGYNESGPPITAAEWAQFTDDFAVLVGGASAAVLSGSLPSGLPADAYRTLAAIAADAGAAVFVDAHAGPLRAALAARPALVKPNEHELAEAAGLTVPVALPEAVRAARRLLADGARSVVVSLGQRGLLAVRSDDAAADVARPDRARLSAALLAVPPAQRGNPVGAGDAAVAALVDGELTGRPWPDRLRRAAAMSAAAVRQPVAGEVDPTDVAELEARTVVSEL